MFINYVSSQLPRHCFNMAFLIDMLFSFFRGGQTDSFGIVFPICAYYQELCELLKVLLAIGPIAIFIYACSCWFAHIELINQLRMIHTIQKLLCDNQLKLCTNSNKSLISFHVFTTTGSETECYISLSGSMKLVCLQDKYKTRDLQEVEFLDAVRSLKLRYFTPREIANLMCFPPSFSMWLVFSQLCTKSRGNISIVLCIIDIHRLN